MDKKTKKDKNLGYFYLSLFTFFILGGIITKRVFGHPEFMMLWHLPGAVFLVLGGHRLTRSNRSRYYAAKRIR